MEKFILRRKISKDDGIYFLNWPQIGKNATHGRMSASRIYILDTRVKPNCRARVTLASIRVQSRHGPEVGSVRRRRSRHSLGRASIRVDFDEERLSGGVPPRVAVAMHRAPSTR
jgi:hypothetical protein